MNLIALTKLNGIDKIHVFNLRPRLVLFRTFLSKYQYRGEYLSDKLRNVVTQAISLSPTLLQKELHFATIINSNVMQR